MTARSITTARIEQRAGTSSNTGRDARPRRAVVAGVFRWVVRIGLAAQFAAGGVLKLTADPMMVEMFAGIGAGQWLRTVIGVLEVAAAAGLLIPRLARPAAVGLVVLMAGAATTNLVLLQSSPALPLVLGAIAAIVAIVGMREGRGR